MSGHVVGKSAARESMDDELVQPRTHCSSNSITSRLATSIGEHSWNEKGSRWSWTPIRSHHSTRPSNPTAPRETVPAIRWTSTGNATKGTTDQHTSATEKHVARSVDQSSGWINWCQSSNSWSSSSNSQWSSTGWQERWVHFLFLFERYRSQTPAIPL